MSYPFAEHLVAFNKMYGLPVAEAPTILGLKRLKDLKEILLKEVSEIDEIIDLYEHLDFHGGHDDESKVKILTMLADLMGDLQVYCGSEMVKWGLPINAILEIIMQSNMSKLGADGQPIVDENGKVQKGPNYWKPEPKIAALLSALLNSK
jgi:predicted HAD superfamily Cof-like phosphohydrolase